MGRTQGMEEEHRTKTKHIGQNWDERKDFIEQRTEYSTWDMENKIRNKDSEIV